MITLFYIIICHSCRCFQYCIYVSDKIVQHICSPQHLRIFQHIESIPTWRPQTTGRWHENMAFGMLPLPHFNFGQKTLSPVSLGVASECVYNHFFSTKTSHTLHQLSEEVLFGHFVLALNSAFHQQLSLADEGYESGSNEDLPTPLRKTPCMYTMYPV